MRSRYKFWLSIFGVGLLSASCDVSPQEQDAAQDGLTAGPCEGLQIPSTSKACRAHLHETCAAIETADECGGMFPLSPDMPEQFSCAWVKVVEFADAACGAPVVSGRCEAVSDGKALCAEVCDPENFDIMGNLGWRPNPERLQLVGMPCSPDSTRLDGPFRAESEFGTCRPNTNDAPDPLCECSEAACAALEAAD